MTARIIKVNEVGAERAVKEACAVLLSGGLVVMPTETVYGLAGKADNVEVLERIYAAKERDRGKPVPLMLSGVAMLETRGFVLSNAQKAISKAFWPGPLTMVLMRNGIAEGVRIPDHNLCRMILSGSGGMLRVTSANQSGEEPALDAAMARNALGGRVDLIIDDGAVEGGVPSTVIKCFNDGFDILREGAISSASIEAVLRSL